MSDTKAALVPVAAKPVLSGQMSYAAQEALIVRGDLATLTPEQRVQYCVHLCQTLGLNYLTRPFDYIVLNNKLTLYARKDATDQLRKIHKINLERPVREIDDKNGVCIVTVDATLPDGRHDSATGAVGLTTLLPVEETVNGKTKVVRYDTVPLTGDARANALMKAETKAKRRVTLSIMGLGFLDETEVETIPKGQVAKIALVDAAKVSEIKVAVEKSGSKLDKHLERFGVTKVEDLNIRQAEDLLTFLEAIQTGL